jgi:hypothetical protein
MSVESKVMQSVSNVVSYLKSQAIQDLYNSSNEGTISVERSELLKIGRILESSIEASFSRASNEIVAVTKELKEK